MDATRLSCILTGIDRSWQAGLQLDGELIPLAGRNAFVAAIEGDTTAFDAVRTALGYPPGHRPLRR